MPRLQDFRSELPPLLRLALPLIFAELAWVSMSIVDTILVGRLPHSALAMASAALAQVLFNTFTFAAGGVLLGLDTLVSQAFGARQIPSANRWFLHGLALAIALSALLTAIFLTGPRLLRRLPVDPAVLDGAIPALTGLIWGVLPLLLYFVLRRYLQAAHHPRPVAFAIISANLINVGGDWLLIFGHTFHIFHSTLRIPAFGVTGSSWATSFARLSLTLFLIAALVLADRRHHYGLVASLRNKLDRSLDPAHFRRLLQLGAPAGAQIFVEIAIFALVTTLIATFGPLPLAGHEVALQCASTTFMVPFAISTATAVRVGHAIGRNRAAQSLEPAPFAQPLHSTSTTPSTPASPAAAGWCGVAAGAAVMLLAAIVLLLMPAAIARLFTPNTAVIAAAVPLLLIAAGFQFFDGLQVTLTGALRGAGNTTAPLYTHLVCYWAIGMPLGCLLGFHFKLGAAGLWLGLLIALTGAAIALLLIWTRTSRSLHPAAAPPS
jgi:MATE family multidrug resistance protein